MINAISVLKGFNRTLPYARTICDRPSVAINGMGRIGKHLLRESIKNGTNIVAVNQPFADMKAVAMALSFDTVHGWYGENVNVHDNNLCIGGKLVRVYHEENPENIKWKDLSVDYVIDSSGKCTEKETAMKHIKAGAKKVIICAPSTTAPMFVKGVNFESYEKSMQVVSNASCTTNCAAPLVKALNKKFGLHNCLMTTAHAVTASQFVHDTVTSRSAMGNIVPSTTGAATALGMVVPELKGKIKGDAVRISVLDVSLLKLYMNVKGDVTADAIKAEIQRLSESDLKNIMNYFDDDSENVSSDLIGCQYSVVVDFKQIQVIDKLVAIGAWYDNEVGYCCRVLDLLSHMIEVDRK